MRGFIRSFFKGKIQNTTLSNDAPPPPVIAGCKNNLACAPARGACTALSFLAVDAPFWQFRALLPSDTMLSMLIPFPFTGRDALKSGEGGRGTSPQGERVPGLSLSAASPVFAHVMDMGVSTICSKQCQKAVPHILPTESVAPICGTPERLAPKT